MHNCNNREIKAGDILVAHKECNEPYHHRDGRRETFPIVQVGGKYEVSRTNLNEFEIKSEGGAHFWFGKKHFYKYFHFADEPEKRSDFIVKIDDGLCEGELGFTTKYHSIEDFVKAIEKKLKIKRDYEKDISGEPISPIPLSESNQKLRDEYKEQTGEEWFKCGYPTKKYVLWLENKLSDSETGKTAKQIEKVSVERFYKALSAMKKLEELIEKYKKL